ncbi:MAG: FAD-dependent oxidoreductase [Spirochaetaceae bacterium]|nr:FAD-dependent oxidoreductase [Spirochaetaceae bacterium]
MPEHRPPAGLFGPGPGGEQVTVYADAFADASYEGDLMALAGCAYRTGRESQLEHGEPSAGRVFVRPVADPPTPEAARAGELHDRLRLRPFPGYAEVLDAPGTGDGDHRVQGYNLRMMITDDPGNQLPVRRPVDYDRDRIAALEHPGLMENLMPNRKMRVNRPQLVGEHIGYAEGSWAERQRIIDAHWRALQGCLHFLRTDPAVAGETRRRWQAWGLAADEFADNGNRPYEIYARETRRLDGRYRFTAHDAMLAPGLERAPVHSTAVAATEWYIDSHACSFERYGDSRHEGKVILHMETFPGMVPYEALLPRELDNLLVVNCVSSTHVGWNTIRLEPTWMNIGEAAGWALALARDAGVAPADVDRQHLVRTLARTGVMVSFCNDVDVASREAWVAAVQYFGTRGFFAGYDVRPDDPLGRRTAEVWLQAAARVGSPDYEPMRTVHAVHDLAADTDEPIDRAALETLLARSPLAGKPGARVLRAPERVTRADFCRLLFALTAPTRAAG